MSLPKNTRKIRSSSGKTFPNGTAPRIGPPRYASVIAEALRRDFGGTHAAVKTVVGLTGVNERSVKNWYAAKNGPSGENLVDLARHSDAVLEAFLTLAGRETLVAAMAADDARQQLSAMIATFRSLGIE